MNIAEKPPARAFMTGIPHHDEFEQTRIMLGLLESVERNGAQTQRHLAAELGIALGLVNAYLKRCVKRGLLKLGQAPARRYAYYLTPHGFAEKSRLTVEYLAYSFSLFRRARSEYADVMKVVRTRDYKRLILAGASDLAEIATICAISEGIQVVGVVDPNSAQARIVGLPVVAGYDLVTDDVDAVIITDLASAQETLAKAIARFGAERVLAPAFLGLSFRTAEAAQ
jgi:DNA-binding MarR family transcriptional regulator